MEIEFKLTETDNHNGEDSADEDHKEGSPNERHGGNHSDSKKYEDEIKSLKEQLQEIKK